jgi:hypothetical protein
VVGEVLRPCRWHTAAMDTPTPTLTPAVRGTVILLWAARTS